MVSLASLAGHHILPSPIPPEFDTPEKRVPWCEQTFQSAASAQMEGFLPSDQNGSDFGIQPDGSLASEFKVAPGTYWVTGVLVQNQKKIARVNQFIDIPADKPGDTNEIFDIGKVQAIPLLVEGSPAPDFDVTSLDGRRFKLSDFRGKYVLLDFWATWCVPCLLELPNLIDTYDSYGKDSRFALISLDLDDDPGTPRKFVERHDMGWTHGWLGDWDQDKISKEYEMQEIPSIWLIGPDGKIIALNLGGPAIKKAVAAALESK
jgi:thiol-disulfide isomerase/thioredoxin